MKYIKILLLFWVMISFFPELLWGQNNQEVTMESLVYDQEGNPVGNASVHGNEGNIVQYTDPAGKFTITVPANSMLLITAEGFKSQEIMAESLPDKIVLESDNAEQIVNVAYNTVEKSDLPGAISVLNPGEYINKDYNFSVTDGMYGRVAGLIGTNNIWNIGNALVLIDGIPRSLSSIRLEEVEQITFLKGANAVALYGSYAANGAILITSKRGEAYKRKINIRANTGLGVPKLYPKYLGSADYMTLYNEARINDGLPELYDEETINNYRIGNRYRYPDIDYYSSEYLSKYIHFNDINAEFSGGNKDARFYSNIGWVNQSTLLNIGEGKEEGDNRFNVRGNVDMKLSSFITTTVDVTARIENSRRGLTDYWYSAATNLPNKYAPLVPMDRIHPDSSNAILLAESSKNIIEDQYILGGTQEYLTNPFADLYVGGYLEYVNRVIQLTNTINIDLGGILSGLSFHTRFNADYYNSYVQSINNQYSVYNPTWDTVPGSDVITGLEKFGNDLRTGKLNVDTAYQTRNLGFSMQFNYLRSLSGGHNISAILLASGTAITNNGIFQPTTNSNLGLQLGYNYKHRYWIDFSSALVNSTKLPEGNRVGFSPTLSLGWLLSAENFLAESNVVNHLKLYVSAGMLNTDLSINDYYLYDNVYRSQGYFAWNDGVYSNSASTSSHGGNPNFAFAKRKELSLSLEASLFKQLLWIESSFFIIRMDDLPTQRFTQYPNYFHDFVPYTAYNCNQLSGFDLLLNLHKNVGQVELNLGVNASYVNTKVKERDELYADDYQNRVGKHTDAMFGLVSDGFFADETEIANHPVQAFGEVQPGDIKYVDQNGDNIINERDEVEIGRWNSPFNYGLNFSISYRNFTIFMLGTGSVGGNSMMSNDYYWVQGDDKYSETVLDRWTEETRNTATYPRLSSQENNNNFRSSDFWIYKTDRFDLSKVQVSFDLPLNNTKQTVLKELGIYVSGANLLTFSENKDIMDLITWSNPTMRYYSVGIRANF